MKRVLSILLVAICLIISGCGTKDTQSEPKPQTKELSVVCTVFPSYDFSREIVGNMGKVTFLLPPSAEAHSYTPSLSDIALIEQSDVFIYVGGETDPWAEDIIQNSNNKERIDISLLKLFDAGQKDEKEEHQHEADEHVWTSIENAIKIVDEIENAVSEKSPENSQHFQAGASEYKKQLTTLQNEYKETVDNSARDTLIFADRFPFYWLLSEFGLNHVSALEGCSSDTEATLTAVRNVIEAVKSTNSPTVFYIENSTKTIAEKVVSETGCEMRLLHSCHNLTKEEQGETYISLMKKNLKNIKEALG